jgi:uroporphyrinogen-III synthase
MILVTRNQEKSNIVSKKLNAKGFKTLICPLFTVRINRVGFFDIILLKLSKVHSIIITSSNAIGYLQKLRMAKSIKLFSIGKETTLELRSLGYTNIIQGDNTAKSLLSIIPKNIYKNDKILYLRGDVVTRNLDVELRNNGFKTQSIIAYKILEKKCLSKSVINGICTSEITDVTAYSKNSVLIFHKLLLKYNLLEYCNKIRLLCLSDEIVTYCRSIGFKKVKNINKILD